VVHVALSWRLRRDEVDNGWVDAMCCVEPFHKIAGFYVLGPMVILVF
jgi:hypothetical protein